MYALMSDVPITVAVVHGAIFRRTASVAATIAPALCASMRRSIPAAIKTGLPKVAASVVDDALREVTEGERDDAGTDTEDPSGDGALCSVLAAHRGGEGMGGLAGGKRYDILNVSHDERPDLFVAVRLASRSPPPEPAA
jgi:hypothetical protein